MARPILCAQILIPPRKFAYLAEMFLPLSVSGVLFCGRQCRLPFAIIFLHGVLFFFLLFHLKFHGNRSRIFAQYQGVHVSQK